MTLTVWRGGKTRDVTLLVEFKDEEATRNVAAKTARRRRQARQAGARRDGGLAEQKKALKVRAGVAVEAADGAAAAAGSSPGD